MTQHFEAVVENGRLCPVEPIALVEGERVSVRIESRNQISPRDMLRLAADVYEGLSEHEIAGIENIALERNDWFARDVKN